MVLLRELEIIHRKQQRRLEIWMPRPRWHVHHVAVFFQAALRHGAVRNPGGTVTVVAGRDDLLVPVRHGLDNGVAAPALELPTLTAATTGTRRWLRLDLRFDTMGSHQRVPCLLPWRSRGRCAEGSRQAPSALP